MREGDDLLAAEANIRTVLILHRGWMLGQVTQLVLLALETGFIHFTQST